MKFARKTLLLSFVLAVLIFSVACSGAKVDVKTLNGESWTKLDKDTQVTAVEELMKSSGGVSADHTAKYFARQINTYFGTPGMSKKLVKDIFTELAVSNKTANELSVVDGHAWKKMGMEEKVKIIQQVVSDISDKNPAFKPKGIDNYLRKMDEVYQSTDDHFLKEPVSDAIKKLLTNNLIINGELMK